jgi:c-di-GMP-binding flagellar brake protein YcgR
MRPRNYERVSFLCKLEVTALPGGVPQPTRSTDLSLGGVGAVTTSTFPVGQLVTVRFFYSDAAHGEANDKVLGRVVHFEADVDANKVGIQFLNPLSDAEHPQLVTRLASV